MTVLSRESNRRDWRGQHSWGAALDGGGTVAVRDSQPVQIAAVGADEAKRRAVALPQKETVVCNSEGGARRGLVGCWG